MNTTTEFGGLADSAAGCSAMYAALSQAFTYEGVQDQALAIPGHAFNEAFDPSVSERACSLREASYAGGDQSSLFEELMRYYSFFGLGRKDSAEMPDHISVELEFMHFLKGLESQSAGNAAAVGSLVRAQKDFLSRHLLRLLGGVRGKLSNCDPRCLDLVEFAETFVAKDLARLKNA